MVLLKVDIYNSFYVGGCGGLERTHFEQLILREGMMFLKELIFNRFYFGTVWWA